MARLAGHARARSSFPSPAIVLGLAIACAAVVKVRAVDVLERGYNRFRTGANTAETILTPANVQTSANRFHKRFVMKVDGKIESSPLYAQTSVGQDLFVRGGTKGGGPIRIRHRNWLNPQTSRYRWGDAHLDWDGGEIGQAQPEGGLGGGSPADWTTSPAEGAGQPFVWTAGYGIAGENTFGKHYWMLDVDMDCEQAFDDGAGRRWFEIKAFVAQTPGWEADVAQTSTPMPPYASINHWACARWSTSSSRTTRTSPPV